MRATYLSIFVMLGLLGMGSRVDALSLPCRYEDALSEAAAELMLSGRPMEAHQILASVRALGFDGVAVQAHEGHDEALLVQWLKLQGERADGPLVCGEARSESRWLVLVSARGGRLWREGNRIRGQLEPGFSKPHLVIESRDGSPKRINVSGADLARGVALAPELDARRVQLVAEGPSGPRPVSEISLDQTAAAPEPGMAEPTSDGSVVQGVQGVRGPRSRPIESLLARLDAFRAEAGAGSLRSNALLTKSAQQHASRVCELGRVAHRLEGGDDPEARLRAERISARAVGEAVARAQSADAALRAVLDSPSHRMAVSERRFTDAGIGQALDQRGNTCLVVLLAAWPRRLP